MIQITQPPKKNASKVSHMKREERHVIINKYVRKEDMEIAGVKKRKKEGPRLGLERPYFPLFLLIFCLRLQKKDTPISFF